jgi:glycosyltransferase involved in cell wall biosynthesis
VGHTQISSGTITHALHLSRPFISTEHVFAEDMAAQGCGMVTRASVDDLANVIADVFADGSELRKMEAAARRLSQTLSWEFTGGALIPRIEQAASGQGC